MFSSAVVVSMLMKESTALVSGADWHNTLVIARLIVCPNTLDASENLSSIS